MANGQGQPPGAGNTGDSATSFSEPVFEALRQRTDVFEDLIGYVPLSFNGSVAVRHGGELPESAEGEEVSGNYFSGLSVPIERGRGFTRADETTHAAVAVLSYDYWTRSFARDPNIVGPDDLYQGRAGYGCWHYRAWIQRESSPRSPRTFGFRSRTGRSSTPGASRPPSTRCTGLLSGGACG